MTNSNFEVNRSKINFIHARDYFPKGEIEEFRPWLENTNWLPSRYGTELENIHLIFRDIDLIMGKMTGDMLEVDKAASGTFRKTMHEVIHFEDFENLDDWRFVVALDPNVFKVYTHKQGWKSHLDWAADTDSAKQEPNWFDPNCWELESQIRMGLNDVLFYRPWVYHSFQDGILHYYKLKVI
jgi:hypothetical protein